MKPPCEIIWAGLCPVMTEASDLVVYIGDGRYMSLTVDVWSAWPDDMVQDVRNAVLALLNEALRARERHDLALEQATRDFIAARPPE